MIVPIHFEHQHQQVRSHLIYNFSSVEDIILVTPVIEYPGIALFTRTNYDLIYKKVGEHEWKLDDKLRPMYAATVRNLNNQLEQHFSDRHFRFTA